MARYKVNASTNENWRQHNSCLLNISMGQKYHEGDKFASLLDWISTNFDFCIINVCETLHRYNLLANSASKEEAYYKAQQLGDEWLERNGSFIDSHITIPCELNRWDDWITKPEYKKLYQDVIEYYRNNAMFKASLEADIRKFIKRIEEKKELLKNIETYRKASTLYLLEETAAYTLMVREYGAARVYPAPELECLKYLKQPNTPTALKGLENSIHINLNFKKRKQTISRAA